MNPKVDAYLANGCGRCKYASTPQCKVHDWTEELVALRRIALESGLVEELKWDMPCYTADKKNIVIVSAFKEYAAVLFFKGSLMKDPKKILTTPTENSQSGRQLRFTDVATIAKLEPVVKAYLKEAVELEKSGAKVEYKKVEEFAVPEELRRRLDGSRQLKAAFEALTPGRRKGYLLHISAAKQAKTRESRIDACVPKILAGKGFDDR